MNQEKEYEDNPFEDEQIAKEWINSVENERGMIREKELYPLLAQWAHRISPKIIVDIGAGQGECADYIQFETTEYLGIEPSIFLVERARERHLKEGRKFVVGNAYHLPIGNTSADAAFSINVWFHLENLNKASRELARILKTNGQFLICTANPEAYDFWFSMFEDPYVDEKKIDGKVNIPVNPLSRNLFFKHTMAEMLNAFRLNQLVIDETKTNGFIEKSEHPLFVNFLGHKI